MEQAGDMPNSINNINATKTYKIKCDRFYRLIYDCENVVKKNNTDFLVLSKNMNETDDMFIIKNISTQVLNNKFYLLNSNYTDPVTNQSMFVLEDCDIETYIKTENYVDTNNSNSVDSTLSSNTLKSTHSDVNKKRTFYFKLNNLKVQNNIIRIAFLSLDDKNFNGEYYTVKYAFVSDHVMVTENTFYNKAKTLALILNYNYKSEFVTDKEQFATNIINNYYKPLFNFVTDQPIFHISIATHLFKNANVNNILSVFTRINGIVFALKQIKNFWNDNRIIKCPIYKHDAINTLYNKCNESNLIEPTCIIYFSSKNLNNDLIKLYISIKSLAYVNNPNNIKTILFELNDISEQNIINTIFNEKIKHYIIQDNNNNYVVCDIRLESPQVY